MKKLLCAVLLCASGVIYAGVDEGRAAYQKGNYAVALKEFEKAAEQGDAGSQISTGFMYSIGLGVQRNVVQAGAWYTKAAEQGSAAGQAILGEMYRVGEGVPQNDKLAYILFDLAASKGAGGSEKGKSMMLKKLSPAALADAQNISTRLSNSKSFAADLRKVLNAKQ